MPKLAKTEMKAPFLRAHQAFERITEEGHQLLINKSFFKSYAPGQLLSTSSNISSEVLLILDGEARLLFRDSGRLRTIEKLKKGAFVGLCSILRVSPCEETSAATHITAISIPDHLVLYLLKSEPSFLDWCQSHLFTIELLYIIDALCATSSSLDVSPLALLSSCKAVSQLVPLSQRTASVDYSKENSHKTLFAASGNIQGFSLYSIISGNIDQIRSNPPLPVRIIGISSEWIQSNIESSDRSSLALTLYPGEKYSDSILATSSLEFGNADTSSPFKLVRATGYREEILACFQMLSSYMQIPYKKDAIKQIIDDILADNSNLKLSDCGNIAAFLGLHASGVKVSSAYCRRLQVPAFILWDGGIAVLVKSNSQGVILASPKHGWVNLTPQEVIHAYPDTINLVQVERSYLTPLKKFGFSWFLPVISRYKTVLFQVFIASLAVQLFSLANPLLIQVIIDKVISQRSLDALQVLGFALVVVTIMEGIIGSMRTFLFTETSNRLDFRLGSEVIDHLLRLPLGYFERRPVGELGSRVAELEKVRNFLTGQGLYTILDTILSVVYIIVMALYSWLLTLIALSVIPIQMSVTVMGAPLFRSQARASAQENAKTQSHLVEILNGIQTVKSQNIETICRSKWQELYSNYINKSFDKTITGTLLAQFSQVLQKLSQLFVLWVGAMLVLDGQLTLGQLIAFRIISGYVTQPLLRLSGIWQNIQDIRVSLERLADVIDAHEESSDLDSKNIPMQRITGDVVFKNVTFAFGSPNAPVLKCINLEVKAGTFVAIVGQSGCGKSTLVKMISRLYTPLEGKVFIDGFDINKVELYSLRRQIGIVPQDPLLFAGTVSENIALANPGATSDQIISAARTACAHDFIMNLPNGYSTQVGERGALLSGGQRQRVAIARTLIAKPRIMILDEATSALDSNTERSLCTNLIEHFKNTTVFFITHRLMTARNADLIVYMHQGSISEIGTFSQLMAMKGRFYANYRMQGEV